MKMKKTLAISLALSINLAYAGETENWGLERISLKNEKANAPFHYNPIETGSGVNVYLLDSGLDDHKEINGRVGSLRDFTGDDSGENPTSDCDGHGTHVAGVIAGNTTGVAKDVKLHSLKIVSCESGGVSSEDLSAALQFLIDNDDPGVINISSHVTTFTEGVSTSDIDNQIGILIDEGFVLVAAAGNTNSSDCGYPAINEHVISVGATDKNDNRWESSSYLGSNYGACVDIFAPGADIASAKVGGGLISNSGTSGAAPHVTGIVAQYLASGIAAKDIKSKIIDSATSGVISNLGQGSPNKLAYSEFTENVTVDNLPETPTGLSVRDLCYGEYRVSWSIQPDDNINYELQAYSSADAPWILYLGHNNSHVFSTYQETYLQVRACKVIDGADECSAFSNSVKTKAGRCR